MEADQASRKRRFAVSLQFSRLEKARELSGGTVQARCPACAETGQDRTGEHLRIYPDGRFGCCVHPKDRDHRKRIFALAGDTSPRAFQVRVAGKKSNPVPALSVKDSLSNYVRTPRTGKSKSDSAAEGFCEAHLSFRTGRTPVSNPCAHRRENEIQDTDIYTCKDFESGVLSVLGCDGQTNPPKERLPYFTPGGTLVIPFEAPEKFHWWKGRQSVSATVTQLRKGEIYADEF
jgi:hypothetical protein